MGTTFETGHLDMVHDAQLDYYGRRLATCSSDRSIKIFELAGEQATPVAQLQGHEGPVWQVAWAHPKFGQMLASCSFDHRVILWKEVAEAQWSQVYKSAGTLHTASINAVAWAPYELGLVLASASSDGTVAVLEYKDGTFETTKIDGVHAIGVTAVSWAPAVPAGAMVSAQPPSGVVKRLVTAGCDNLAKVWRWGEAGWQQEAVLAGHADWVRDAAWAPNLGLPTSTIATAGQDGKVYAWTEGTEGGWSKTLVHDFAPHPVWKLSWSITGGILAVSDGSNATTLWKETVDGVWQQVQQ